MRIGRERGGGCVERPETKKQIEQEPSTDFVNYRLDTWTGCPPLVELPSYSESIYDMKDPPISLFCPQPSQNKNGSGQLSTVHYDTLLVSLASCHPPPPGPK